MVRPIYPHELADPDFSWLLTTFKENHPNFVSVEGAGLPLVLINFEKECEKMQVEGEVHIQIEEKELESKKSTNT